MQHPGETKEEISRLKSHFESRRRSHRRMPHSVASAYRRLIAEYEERLGEPPRKPKRS